MKKVLMIFLLFGLAVGCGMKNTAKIAVEDFLNKYKTNEINIISELNAIADKEDFNESQKEEYIKILKEQYKNLNYEILGEEYEDDEATVTVKITVKDLYKVGKDVNNYLAENRSVFNDQNGNFNRDLFLNYNLEQMKNTTDTIDYTIDFFVTKSGENWYVTQPRITVLEKIHGIYNYDNK